jgi:hypothetical protein
MAKGDEKKLLMRKVGQSLIPFDGHDWLTLNMFEKVKENKFLLVSITQPRSLPHNRWFFALLGKIVENNEVFVSIEEIKEALKQATGLIKVRENPLNGQVYFDKASLSFEDMDEIEFSEWVQKALPFLNRCFECDVIEVYMPEIKKDEKKKLPAQKKTNNF